MTRFILKSQKWSKTKIDSSLNENKKAPRSALFLLRKARLYFYKQTRCKSVNIVSVCVIKQGHESYLRKNCKSTIAHTYHSINRPSVHSQVAFDACFILISRKAELLFIHILNSYFTHNSCTDVKRFVWIE